MTTFHYRLTEAGPPSPWDGLSDEAKASLSRRPIGPSAASQLLTPNGLEDRSAETHYWAHTELENSLAGWGQYIGKVEMHNIPRVYTDIVRGNPNFAQTIARLHEASQSFALSNMVTPESLNIGETMHLALMPWQEIRNHLDDFDKWVKILRQAQGIATDNDFIHKHLLKAIKSNQPFYHDPSHPFQLLSPSQYLDRKIAEDGPWGVMLIQTSQEAGIEQIKGRSPDEMTANCSQHLELAGHSIDAMGVFEWLALTLQKDPRGLSVQDASWLLANLITIDDNPHVPAGLWHDEQVKSDLYGADFASVDVRVRLAAQVNL